MKKKTINIIIGILLSVLLISELVYSLNNTEASDRQTGETIQLVHIPYDTEIASTTILSLVLEEDHPEAYQIIDNFYWEVEDMDSVTYAMENGADDRTAAQNWIDDNRDVVDSWLDIDTEEE